MSIATFAMSILFALVVVLTSNLGAHADDDAVKVQYKQHLKRTVIIVNARPDLVWSSIAEARTDDPEIHYGKILTQDGANCTAEQKFDVPMIGAATCTFAITNMAPNRVDYKMTSSDVFTDLLGSWQLTPVAGGKTKLELSCYAGIKRSAPRFIVDSVVTQLIKKRISYVRTRAEKKEDFVARKEAAASHLSARADKAIGHVD